MGCHLPNSAVPVAVPAGVVVVADRLAASTDAEDSAEVVADCALDAGAGDDDVATALDGAVDDALVCSDVVGAGVVDSDVTVWVTVDSSVVVAGASTEGFEPVP